MKLRPMTDTDAIYADNHSVSRGISSKEPPVVNFCQTLEDEGKIMAVGGIRLVNLTTAWCWVNLTDSAGEKPQTVFRAMQKWLDGMARTHGLNRLQAYVEVNFPEAIKMIELLGFYRESLMKSFVGNHDAYMYAKVI